MKKIITFILCITIPIIIGAIGGIATSSGLDNWYLAVNKPSFNPPNYVFGPVWSCLYILMGISLYMILQTPASVRKNIAIGIFSIQLTLNLIALLEIILIWISILIMIISFFRIKKVAGLLQIPYLLWVSFASILNASYWLLN
jgi:tryptophan-rich sensory protein